MVQNPPAKKEWVFRIAITFLALVVTLFLAQWIAEKYFFDLLIYQKSVKYGYVLSNKGGELKPFGRRAFDMMTLLNHPERLHSENAQFTIAIIGDSYVWGQGIRNKDRFAAILEKKIQRVRSARVLSLALCGDSLFDHYVKYQILMAHTGQVDFLVFVIVRNDLILNDFIRYKSEISAERSFGCPGPFVYAPRSDPNDAMAYSHAVEKSYDNSFGNLCLLNKLAERLPKTNSIYMSGHYNENNNMNIYMQVLKDHGLRVVTVKDYPDLYERYKDYRFKDFIVSQKDPHPSALANKMFAEMIWEELSHRGLL